MCKLQCNNTIIIISELQNVSVHVPFFHMEKANSFEIVWGLDKNSTALFSGSLCRVFVIQMTQRKLQPSGEDIPASVISLVRRMFCGNEEPVSFHRCYPISLLLLLPLFNWAQVHTHKLIWFSMFCLNLSISWKSKPEFWARTLGIMSLNSKLDPAFNAGLILSQGFCHCCLHCLSTWNRTITNSILNSPQAISYCNLVWVCLLGLLTNNVTEQGLLYFSIKVSFSSPNVYSYTSPACPKQSGFGPLKKWELLHCKQESAFLYFSFYF